MAPTCFGPFGPSSGSIRRNLAKVTVVVEIISKKYVVKIVAVLWQYVLCVLGAVGRETPDSTQNTRLLLPLHRNNFNVVFFTNNFYNDCNFSKVPSYAT
jgi:hypothetical protein